MYVNSFGWTGPGMRPLGNGSAGAIKSPTSLSSTAPHMVLPKTRHRKSCSFDAANINADGIELALYTRFIWPGTRLALASALAPVPTETSSIVCSPTGQHRLYGAMVAMRNNWKAGLLYIVTPPSTNMNCWSPTWIGCGGKYVGAAVLARTSCQSSRSRLQSPSVRALYLASGLLETGHGESVVAFRITRSSSVFS